jgi:hypothetical protein
MFQVLSGDGWASDVARPLFVKNEEDEKSGNKTDPTVAFFFVSYILINSVMLLNVVVAVLLVSLQRVRYSKASMLAHESESLACGCRMSSFLP